MTREERKELNDILRAGVEYGKENRINYTYFQQRLKVSHSCFYKWLRNKFDFKDKKSKELLKILEELNII